MMLKLFAVFSVAVVFTGCDPNVKELKDDVRAIKTDIAEFKKEITDFKERAATAIRAYLDNLPKQAACAAPGKHSDQPCVYKLKIVKTPASPNATFQGQVPSDVVQTLNQECQEKHTFKSRCPKSGDENTHDFYMNNAPDGLKAGDMVTCQSDPKTDHLNCMLEKT
jgi:hypothetical protein